METHLYIYLMIRVVVVCSFSLPYFLMFFGFITSNVKVALTALERLLELLDVPHEAAWHLATDKKLPPTVCQSVNYWTWCFCDSFSLSLSLSLSLCACVAHTIAFWLLIRFNYHA